MGALRAGSCSSPLLQQSTDKLAELCDAVVLAYVTQPCTTPTQATGNEEWLSPMEGRHRLRPSCPTKPRAPDTGAATQTARCSSRRVACYGVVRQAANQHFARCTPTGCNMHPASRDDSPGRIPGDGGIAYAFPPILGALPCCSPSSVALRAMEDKLESLGRITFPRSRTA